VVTLNSGTPIRCMLANDGAGSAFDRGTLVSLYLPCEALRVLRTETTAPNEEEQAFSSQLSAVSAKKS
jgi:hypothetical protein